MKELLKQYTAYNAWANQKIVDAVKTLSEEQVQREINSSFRSIYKTLVHCWGAEHIWWLRMQRLPQDDIPALSFTGTTEEACNNLMQQSIIWKDWVADLSEAQLQEDLAYQTLAKENFKQPVYEILQHLFNHGTFHRGQFITMFRQVGLQEIPKTDFIVFCRGK